MRHTHSIKQKSFCFLTSVTIFIVMIFTAFPAKAAPTPNSWWLEPGNVARTSSVWKQNISTAPLATNSAAEVADVAHQVDEYYGGVAAFNNSQYDVAWYNVTKNVPGVTIAYSNCENTGYTPSGLYGTNGQFVNVPIPARAVPASGTDSSISIYRPATGQLWDFWEFKKTSTGYSACWGGRIDNVHQNPGYFLNGFGTSASGLAFEMGAVTIKDVQNGVINHAIDLAIPSTAASNDVSWPAQRSDGYDPDSPDAPPEGTRLRLDPSIDVASLHLNPVAAMIAVAAQKYGFIITDRSGAVAITAEDGGPYQRAAGTNPWDALLDGTPSYSVLANFPWSRLQALPKNYGEPSSS